MAKASEKVVHEFKTDREITKWLADESNHQALKMQYPPPAHGARVDLASRQVIVFKKDGSSFDQGTG